MKRKASIVVLVFAFCAILLPAMGSMKNPVKRPHKVWGNMMMTITDVDMQNGIASFEFVDYGHATHFGQYEEVGEGTLNLLTFVLECTGEITAANGDTIEYSAVELPGSNQMAITFTTGTGRFEGVTGEVIAVHEPLPLPANPMDLLGASVSFNFTASGWIMY